ncbi:MAG: T9SS type A sorting domain-containing protein [Candidatus Azobacteroides sp.]|nr:T9SS type A sorting domain-containing protein [Candidatus Azobacteroides sp.]
MKTQLNETGQHFGHLFIQSESPVEKIKIYNQSGICVLINDNPIEKLDVSSLANGFYLVRIYVDGMPVSKKIVIRK